MRLRFLALAAALAGILAAGCAGCADSQVRLGAKAPLIGMPNPASVDCIEAGGRLVLRVRPDGGQYGVCVLGEDRLCEEWARFRGQCPPGGVDVSGLDSPAAEYCAITGGRFRVGAAGTKGRCVTPGGAVCDAGAYYRGQCPPAKEYETK